MPTDPATVPPLTDAEVAELVYAQCPTLRSEEKNATAQWWVGDVARAAYALAASRVDTAEVERRAKYEALTEARSVAMRPGTWEQVDDRLKAFAEKYAPAPRECVLSDGSVVIVERQFERFNRGNGTRYAGLHFWREILDDSDTGADFDALKRFAAEVGQ